MASANPPTPQNGAAGEPRRPEPKDRRTSDAIPLAQDYNPYDARNFDSGGFGFGGTNGSAGGFGVGGNGPQTGSYGSQANYGQGYEPRSYDTWADDSYGPQHFDEPHRPERHDWFEGLPHDFHGWGPQAPDYGPSRGSAPRPAPRRRRHIDDHHYLSWRTEQMRRLDDEYHAWRTERQAKFNEDFETWRAQRGSPKPGQGAHVTAPSSPGQAMLDPKED